MTLQGTLIAFMKQVWGLSAPLGTANIYWSEDWYNPKKAEYPQISVTPLTDPMLQRFRTHKSIQQLHTTFFNINCWVKSPAGGAGTKPLDQAMQMKREVCRTFLEGIETDYGGSLSPWGAVTPRNKGIPRHELMRNPRLYRYEVTIVATDHFTK